MRKNKLEKLKEKIFEAEPTDTFYVYVPTIVKKSKSGGIASWFGLRYTKAKVYALKQDDSIRLFACVKGYFQLFELNKDNFKTIEEYENETNKEN